MLFYKGDWILDKNYKETFLITEVDLVYNLVYVIESGSQTEKLTQYDTLCKKLFWGEYVVVTETTLPLVRLLYE